MNAYISTKNICKTCVYFKNFQNEGSNFQKVMKFLELLPYHCDTKGFQKLCMILEREHEWLADELRAELRAEKGQGHKELTKAYLFNLID